MQESENKGRHAAKHSAEPDVLINVSSADESAEPKKEPKPAAEDASKTAPPIESDLDEELFGTEDEVPLRMRKKPSGKRREAPKTKTRVRQKAQPRTKRIGGDGKTYSEKTFHQKKSLFEIMSAAGGGRIQPIHVFGHEIRFWPLIVVLIVKPTGLLGKKVNVKV